MIIHKLTMKVYQQKNTLVLCSRRHFVPFKYEPPHGKTNNLHRRKQRRRSASQFLFYLNPKFQASSSFLCLYRLVCVGPVRKPHCWFSHEAAHMSKPWYKSATKTQAAFQCLYFHTLVQLRS